MSSARICFRNDAVRCFSNESSGWRDDDFVMRSGLHGGDEKPSERLGRFQGTEMGAASSGASNTRDQMLAFAPRPAWTNSAYRLSQSSDWQSRRCASRALWHGSWRVADIAFRRPVHRLEHSRAVSSEELGQVLGHRQIGDGRHSPSRTRAIRPFHRPAPCPRHLLHLGAFAPHDRLPWIY